jgi:hypothetical protein
MELVKKFSAFYRTRRFITVFTEVHHRSLSRARWIRSTPSQRITQRSTLILSSHLRLGLPSDLFLSGFPTKIVYAFLMSYSSRHRIAFFKATEVLNLPHRAVLSQVASFATLRVASCLHSPGLRYSYCNVPRFCCDLEACNLVTATIVRPTVFGLVFASWMWSSVDSPVVFEG